MVRTNSEKFGMFWAIFDVVSQSETDLTNETMKGTEMAIPYYYY
tara:strand:+ start:782 stop:913 length:132 start_codon:yes stop_codon:yes gene_type:complete